MGSPDFFHHVNFHVQAKSLLRIIGLKIVKKPGA
jgi:hypothetical protein